MAFDLYKTKTMLAAVRQMEPVRSFLRDRYFPTGAGDLFPTEEVLVEYRDGSNRKMAPVVLPRKGGIAVEREGYTTARMAPPLVAPKRPLTIDDLNKKGFGENLFSGVSPAQRQADILRQDLTDMDEMHTNREEYIASRCLFENGYVLRQYADEYGGDSYVEYEMHFYEGSANPAVYLPGEMWSGAASNKLADLHVMARMLTSAGNAVSDVLLGSDAAESLLSDGKIKELMDLQRYNMGEIAPILMEQGAALLGRLNVRGRMLNLITYDGTYEDEETGAVKELIPAKSICVTAPNAGRALYGAVTQLEQEDGQFHSYMGRRVPRYLADPDNDIRELRVSSRPMLIPRTKNPFIVSAVLA